MASDSKASQGIPAIVFVIAAVALLALAGWGYLRYLDRQSADNLSLTDDAKAYVRDNNLRLADVEMKASESYLKQTIVEITGKIANAGQRPIGVVDVYCVFRDPYGQLILRRRLSIVSGRMGGLPPGETKTFRLPFDDIPQSWNNAMPQLVIAGVKFS